MKASKCLIGAVAWATWVITSMAGPLQLTQVINDPAWVIHLDCDELRQTSLGKQLLNVLAQPEAQKKFESFQTVFGADPRKDLHGVTIFSATKSEADGILLVHADFDPERLVALVQANKDYEVKSHGAHKIHSWIDDKKRSKGEDERVYGAIFLSKVIVVGRKQSTVTQALDVLDGTQVSLAGNKTFASLGVKGAGAFIIGGATALDFGGKDLSAAVLKQAKLIWLNAREAQDKLELGLTLETASAETAKQLGDVCRGLVAVLALQTDKPQAVKLAQAMAVEQEAAMVMAKLSLPTADLLQMIKERTEK